MKNKITVIITAIALISSSAWAEETKQQTTIQDDIRKLMEVTGAMDLGNQMFAQMMPILKQNSPDVPDEIWAEFFAELDTDRLLELTIPVYEKHFTQAEIKELLAFYETPIGKKLISVQPEIVKDSMAASQVWGQEIYQKVSKKLIAYYEKNPPNQNMEPMLKTPAE